ncbi:MAG: DUF1801 domain-containing protein [Hyphomonadaceae bacterium]|jgi:hypothetical protein|nr:DUF1801 domain-containing protein [Hyphomonadaceae bacterium]
MARAGLKTKPSDVSPDDLIAKVDHPVRQRDGLALLSLYRRITGLGPKVWGSSMIGFGRYDYVYDSGHSGSMMAAGFAPRKAEMVIYNLPGYDGLEDLLTRLGPHRIGKSCLYLKDLSKIDIAVLEELIASGFADMQKRYTVHPA